MWRPVSVIAPEDKMEKRRNTGRSNVRILRAVMVGIEQWMRHATLAVSPSGKMKERLHSGGDDVGVAFQVVSLVKQGAQPGQFALAEETIGKWQRSYYEHHAFAMGTADVF